MEAPIDFRPAAAAPGRDGVPLWRPARRPFPAFLPGGVKRAARVDPDRPAVEPKSGQLPQPA